MEKQTGWLSLFAALAAAAAFAHPARADEPTATLILWGHRFVPDRLEVPANRKVRLVIKNADPTPEEFDSARLHREKVIEVLGRYL